MKSTGNKVLFDVVLSLRKSVLETGMWLCFKGSSPNFASNIKRTEANYWKHW